MGPLLPSGFSQEGQNCGTCSGDCGPVWLLSRRGRTVVRSCFLKRGQNCRPCSGDCGPVCHRRAVSSVSPRHPTLVCSPKTTDTCLQSPRRCPRQWNFIRYMPGPGCHRTARGPRMSSSTCDVQGGLCVGSRVKSTMG